MSQLAIAYRQTVARDELSETVLLSKRGTLAKLEEEMKCLAAIEKRIAPPTIADRPRSAQ